MATPGRLTRAEASLRQHALAYPETNEEFPWGHRAIKVKGKAFLFMAVVDNVLSLSVKLPLSGRVALTFPFASPTGYGLGKSGWVTAKFGAKDDVPIYMLEEWIDESFRAVAPKKLVAKLEGAEAEPPTEQRRKKKSR
ncbi:MAG TPA: MmcQ/YjbR family DNA-binding protein [Gemmataceae bacterium]|nr:MmcQ/YjbR family DNA-binding protein [Gemmataceae bacterium]